MKRVFCLLFAASALITLLGCSSGEGKTPAPAGQGQSVNDILNQEALLESKTEEKDEAPSRKTADFTIPEGGYDVDLTVLNSTMVYAQVYDMMVSPEQYLGKTVKIKGNFTYEEGENRYYFACLISDATACCAQGIEFVLKEDLAFPAEYPALYTEITVAGVFDVYYEGTNRFCQLIDAEIAW